MSNNAQQEIATPDNAITKSRRVRTKTPPKFGTTRWLTYTAVFTALAIVMKLIGQFLTFNDAFKVTLIYTVWLVAAAVVGPIGGGSVCFISDILGAIIVPKGAINPLLAFGCTMYGVVAGLCFKYSPSESYVVRFLISGIVCSIFVSLIFDSFAIWVWCKYYLKLKSFMEKSFWVYLGPSRALQLAVGAINIAITLSLIPLLKKLKLLPPQKKPILDMEDINA